jgi:hypothetical protein
LWMIHPNILPPTVAEGASGSGDATSARPPRAEYLATLNRHSAAVNVVRFSPNGELLHVPVALFAVCISVVLRKFELCLLLGPFVCYTRHETLWLPRSSVSFSIEHI